MVVHGWQDVLHGDADAAIVDHFREAVGVHALSHEVYLVNVVLAERLDRLPAQDGLLKATVTGGSAVGSSGAATRLPPAADLLK